MTDFSKLFTDPSAQVYEPDSTESALWQQSTTNPFAVLHALAARRSAGQRRDQYGEQLAAHDARAQEGASALSAQEFRQNIPLEYIKRDQLDPSFGMDLAGLRMQNGEVDPRIRRQSHAFQAGQSAGAMKTHAEGVKAYGEAGYKLDDPGRLPDKYLNLSDLVEAPTLGEREAGARNKAEMGTQTIQDVEIAKPGATATRTVTTKVPLGTVPTKGVTQTAPKAPPTTSAVGITPIKSPAEMKAMPIEQQRVVKQYIDGIQQAGTVMRLVPNTLQRDAEGNIRLIVRGVVNGKTMDQPLMITPDGRAMDAEL